MKEVKRKNHERFLEKFEEFKSKNLKEFQSKIMLDFMDDLGMRTFKVNFTKYNKHLVIIRITEPEMMKPETTYDSVNDNSTGINMTHNMLIKN